MDVETTRRMVGQKSMNRVRGHRGWRWNLREWSPVRPPKLKRTVRLLLHPEALLVDRAVVPATGQREVRQRGGAALRLVADVMAFAAR
jgi:hypothetical protein